MRDHWYDPSDYDNDRFYDCDYDRDEWIRKDSLPDFDDMLRHMQSIVRCVYMTGDIETLGDSIDELQSLITAACEAKQLDYNPKQIKLMRKI